jgi:hypothetical protein
MNHQDLKFLTQLGRTLWVDSEEWERAIVEVITAVSLLTTTEDRAVERAATLILDRAQKGDRTNSQLLNSELWMIPFYRLSVEDRLILGALHWGGWSYSRLSRVLNQTEDQIQQKAWRSRIQLALPTAFPAAVGMRGVNCPDYDSHQPWTQKFLDNEISSRRDRLFLQNHVMACASCRRTLEKCREIYYLAEKSVPSGEQGAFLCSSLEAILAQNPNQKKKLYQEFMHSLGFAWRTWDMRLVLLLGVFVMVCAWFKGR